MRPTLILAAVFALSGHVPAQNKAPGPLKPEKVEPGLETAVNWKWWVVPSEEKEWGLPLPETTLKAGVPGDATASATSEVRPTTYEVQKGDALILIGKKFGMTAAQLKAFNGLATDTIRIGQIIKIPTLEELKALAPPPEPAKPKEESATKAPPKPEPEFASQGQEDLLLQVFLDREQFSTGPIDGSAGPMFALASRLYGETHEDAQNIDTFRAKARQVVGDPVTTYQLREEDFRFIEQSEEATEPGKKNSRSKSKSETQSHAITYEELTAAKALVYRTPWEFVAERFHCEETYLKGLNSRIKGNPAVGAELRVPNVIPFEIEKALEGTLQPAADPAKAISAAIVDLTRLEISQDGKVIAMMPLALARPDLRGRGAWTILDAIPRPKLATKQESKDEPKKSSGGAPGEPAGASPVPAALPVTEPGLSAEQYLAAGPNNPVGVVWINLAKAKSTEALPYGLHGTSIPSRMKTQEGIGGLRLANWDIIRAVRLLPAGTPLHWK